MSYEETRVLPKFFFQGIEMALSSVGVHSYDQHERFTDCLIGLLLRIRWKYKVKSIKSHRRKGLYSVWKFMSLNSRRLDLCNEKNKKKTALADSMKDYFRASQCVAEPSATEESWVNQYHVYIYIVFLK